MNKYLNMVISMLVILSIALLLMIYSLLYDPFKLNTKKYLDKTPIVTYVPNSNHDYVNIYCKGQKLVFIDSNYIDCIDGETAWKYAFDFDWQEALGKVLSYKTKVNKQLGIVLIINTPMATDNIKLLEHTVDINNLPIRIRVVQRVGGFPITYGD